MQRPRQRRDAPRCTPGHTARHQLPRRCEGARGPGPHRSRTRPCHLTCHGVTARYSDDERAQAIDLYCSRGGKYAEAETGIKRATIRQWAKRAGRTMNAERTAGLTAANAVQSAEWSLRRAALANRLGCQADEIADVLAGLIASAYIAPAAALRTARDAAMVLSTLIANAQLLSGSATSRTESIETLRAEGARLIDELTKGTR